MYSIVLPIWAGCQFRPVRVRLFGGDAELLLGMGIIRKLRIAVDFGDRCFGSGHGGWHVTAYNGRNRWVFPLSPTARGYTKLEEYSARMRNYDLEVLAVQSGFGGISEVGKAPAPKQESGKNSMRIVESDVANLKDDPHDIYRKKPSCIMDAKWQLRNVNGVAIDCETACE